ncbi:head decoration protein [Chitinibacter sp. GC72]|uniref:head decoration protein n=1 Tax=Chitinibacter sp. GC72 TaxID=1526917 RepID=UPI0012FAFD88|nr:head decoration protein [Chitinibacter sp. GC72]
MPKQQEPINLGDLLKYEAPNLYSRDTGTIAAGQVLALGTVLGRASVSGKLGQLDPTATDGHETAVAILAQDIDTSLIEHDDALLIARHAIVARQTLIWPSGISAAQKTTALNQLEARGILARTSA